MKKAQIEGTEAGNNWIGYIIDQTPGSMLVVQPTVEMRTLVERKICAINREYIMFKK
ncbi:MAG: phage terminase large subunit family protein [Wolbachia sp.]